MKKITNKKATYVTVIDKYVDETLFETEDGQQFANENAAKEHEETLDFQKRFSVIENRNTDIDFPDVGSCSWYFAADQDELGLIIQRFGGLKQDYSYKYFNDNSISVLNQPAVGDWITCSYEDGGDSRDTYNYYTLEYVKNKLNIFLNTFK